MTVLVTCQYTGIQFEAASARSKNHPAVAKFIDQASSDRFHVGAYGKAKELLTAAKGQSDDIREIMAAVNEAYASWLNGEAQPKLRIVKQWTPGRHVDDGQYDELTDGNAFSGTYRR